MSVLTSYKALGNDVYVGPPPNPNILKYLKTINVKTILCLDEPTDEKIKNGINEAGFDDIYVEVGVGSSVFNQSEINYLKNNIKNIFIKKPIYVYSATNIDKIAFVIALYKIRAMNQPPKDVISELNSKLNFGKNGVNSRLYKSWETYLNLLDPKNKDKKVQDESGTTIESGAADDGALNVDLNDLISHICQINNLPNPLDYHNLPSFAPFADTPYLAVDPKLDDFQRASNERINKMIQMGQYSNMAQTRGAGAVEGEGPLNIYLI